MRLEVLTVPPVRLLGPVELDADGAGLGGPKQRLLFVLLATRPDRVVPVDVLVEALWADGSADDAHRSLQVQVSKLRRVLEHSGLEVGIDHRPPGYVLELPAALTDLHAFEAMVEQGLQQLADDPDGAGALLGEALSLWRGRPFGELGDHPALAGETARLEDLRLRAWEARLDADLVAGRHADVVAVARRLTDEHPLRERFWAQRMIALYRSGRQGHALEVYETARRRLAEDLGVDPSPGLREVHRRILQQDPTLDRAADEPGHGRDADSPTAGLTDDPRALAVLPFEVIGPGEEVTYLALGLHNDLCTELSAVPGLTVIGRTSVLAYADERPPPAVIARELRVGTLATGTLQSVGTRFRLTIQLVDAATGRPCWTGSYDHELTTENLFAIQTDLAKEVAGALSATLRPIAAGVGPDGPPTGSLAAYRLVAEGRHHAELRTEDGLARAISRFEEAVDLDPDYAEAWTELSDALVTTEAYGHGDRHELLPRAERAVHRALAIAAEAPEARTSLGILHTAYQDGPAALTEFERAVAARPNGSAAHSWISWVSLLVGRAEAAIGSAARAAELDPRSAEVHAHLALAYAAVGEPDRALASVRLARRLSPYTTADLYEAICLCELGRFEDRARCCSRSRPSSARIWWCRGRDAPLTRCSPRVRLPWASWMPPVGSPRPSTTCGSPSRRASRPWPPVRSTTRSAGSPGPAASRPGPAWRCTTTTVRGGPRSPGPPSTPTWSSAHTAAGASRADPPIGADARWRKRHESVW